jgi:hypothetical protein
MGEKSQMKHNMKWALLFLLALLLISCSNTAQLTKPQIAPDQAATPTIEVMPVIIPGAAPDFRSQARVAYNILESFRNPLFYEAIMRWAKNFEVNQGGVIWISMLVAILVAFNFKRFKSLRNFDIALLVLPGIFIVNLVNLGNTPLDDGDQILFSFLYLGLFLSTIALLIRAIMRAYHKDLEDFLPNLPKAALIILTCLFVGLNIFSALVRRPDDAGAYTNIGAFQMLKTGHFPYGDANLSGGAAATYGPVLYLSHMPFQIILKPVVEKLAPQSIAFRAIVGNNDPSYNGPPLMATKLTMISFLLLAVVSLYFVGRQLSNSTVGWALALLFVSSSYVQGLGGDQWYITGITYISHIAPVGLTLLAFLLIKKYPSVSGITLAAGAGALYYPIFFFPAWFGYYFWRRTGWVKFMLGFVVTCAVIGGAVLLLTQPAPNKTVLQTIYESTVGHQEAQNMYGSSTFSFWSTQPKIAALWQKQFIEGQYLLRPSVLIFAAFLAATFFIARGRSQVQLAALTAAIAIAIQLWKSHAGGSYVEWYYPFFLIAMFCSSKTLNQAEPAVEAAS